MKTGLLEVTMILAAASISAGTARAEPDCGPAMARYKAVERDHGGELPADQASALGSDLLNALAAAPPGTCRFNLVQAAIVMLGQCGREADAAAAAKDVLAAETDPWRRAMLANYFVGLKGKALRWRLDAAAREEVRRAAQDGLVGLAPPEAMVAGEKLDDLATLMPLHHVVGSTEPAGPARIEALRRLLRVCRDAALVAERRGRTSPVEMDRFDLAKEIAHELGTAGAATVENIVECVHAVPWDGTPNRSASDLLAQVNQDKAISLRVRLGVLERLDAEMPSDATRVTTRNWLVSEMVRGLGADAGTEDVQRVYDAVAAHRRWLLDVAARTPAGETPGRLAASRWEGMLHTALCQEWELADRRLARPDLAVDPALEHVRRFPAVPPSTDMQRFLAKQGR